jgi:SAM-dependent methyltransferase
VADEYVVRNAREYETGVADYASYNEDRAPIMGYLDALCERTATGTTILDLGCGPGWETATLHNRGYVAVGFDLSRALLDYGRRNHPADAHVRGDMRRLPFASDSFNGCWACASLLHMSRADLDVALAELARVLRPGAAFVGSVQVGDRECFVPRKSAPGSELFYGYLAPEDWRARVEAAGFLVEELVSEVSEEEQPHLNEGSRGWATVIARRGE